MNRKGGVENEESTNRFLERGHKGLGGSGPKLQVGD